MSHRPQVSKCLDVHFPHPNDEITGIEYTENGTRFNLLVTYGRIRGGSVTANNLAVFLMKPDGSFVLGGRHHVSVIKKGMFWSAAIKNVPVSNTDQRYHLVVAFDPATAGPCHDHSTHNLSRVIRFTIKASARAPAVTAGQPDAAQATDHECRQAAVAQGAAQQPTGRYDIPIQQPENDDILCPQFTAYGADAEGFGPPTEAHMIPTNGQPIPGTAIGMGLPPGTWSYQFMNVPEETGYTLRVQRVENGNVVAIGRSLRLTVDSTACTPPDEGVGVPPPP